MSISLIWLNDTLRLHDNPLLHVNSGLKAAVVVLDTQAYFGQQYGITRANLHRLQQQLLLIHQIKQQLATHNVGLITLFADIDTGIAELAVQLGADQLYCAEPVGVYEQAALARLSQTLSVTPLDCNSLLGGALRPQLAPLPDSFTPFRKQLEPALQVSAPLPDLPLCSNWLPPTQCERYNSGFDRLFQDYQPLCKDTAASEPAALQRLTHFIWQSQHILHYKQSRNQLFGTDYASFCSAGLAVGSLSVRHVWQQITRFEAELTANESTYWLKFELLWREFFRWQFRKYGSRWFSRNGIQQAKTLTPDFEAPQLSLQQRNKFNCWCAGDTGNAFIDANMRLLNQTGLMSNRGRQNVASYLIYDLGLDWRLGAAYFEQRLLDYDCASNWGNWAYIAGTGNSSPRRFNTEKQAQQYDAEAEFVKTMLPARRQ